MKNAKANWFGLALLGALVALSAATVAAAGGGFLLPSAAVPVGTPAPTPARTPSGFGIHGEGARASEALTLSVSQLPFVPELPTFIPPGYRLAGSESSSADPTRGLLDTHYLSESGGPLQIFQANYGTDKSIAAPSRTYEAMTILGRSWEYRLLEYPQPNGKTYLVHAMTHTFDGRLHLSVALHSNSGDLEQERKTLLAVVESLASGVAWNSVG